MLKINRIKGISRCEDTNFGFDYVLKDGLNLITSDINTRGKSSSILAIYYCLGFEEIVGGKGMKTLTAAYKTVLEDEQQNQHMVLESEAWIEITNGIDTVTLMRAGKMIGRDENLISVYFSKMDDVLKPDTYAENMYVHSQRSTTSSKGFHTFLEKFMGLELPLLPTNSDTEYKLYLQLLFSLAFIEQKRGWADLFSAMPVYNFKEPKKRTVEYILGLKTFANERKRAAFKFREAYISNNWSSMVNDILSLCNREDCRIFGLPMKPRIWGDDVEGRLSIMTIGQNPEGIDLKILSLENEYKQLVGTTPKIVDNYDRLLDELETTENYIAEFEGDLESQRKFLVSEKAIISKLELNLETIEGDLRNNKDALKLKQMGSELDINSYKGVCPVCHQVMEDSLLPVQSDDHIMSIEDNIKHLESQMAMIRFAYDSHKANKNLASENIQSLTSRIFTLRRLAKTIRNDINSVDDNISEAVVYKRLKMENRIQLLNDLRESCSQKLESLRLLSDEWKNYLEEKSGLPKQNFSETDKRKLSIFSEYFKNSLKTFNYQSVIDYNSIKISEDSYLPISEGFDMKFDSSASDNIRAIWAYTLALLRTSIETGGNHPQIVIFDEPAQHSIVTEDVMSLFNEITQMPGNKQVIMGITLNDNGIRNAVRNYNPELINIVNVGNHAFQCITTT